MYEPKHFPLFYNRISRTDLTVLTNAQAYPGLPFPFVVGLSRAEPEIVETDGNWMQMAKEDVNVHDSERTSG
jgi:pseudouridine-5'-phosphate glycosidase